MEKSIAIILPAYNEERTIAPTIRAFRQACPQAALYVVDNNSSDRTTAVAVATLAEGLGATGGVLHEARQGKSFAVRRAFSQIEADIYVMVDADSTYDAGNLAALLEPVVAGRADMTVGNRHASGEYRRANQRPFHNLGNTLVRDLINVLFQTNLQDVLSGYRVFSRRFVKTFPILCAGFELETEITLHALDCRLAVIELPVSYRDRPPASHSKLNTFRDGARVLAKIFSILRYNRPLLFFGSTAVLLGCAGLAVGAVPVFEFLKTGLILHIPSAILATGLIICALISFALAAILDTIARINRQRFELLLVAASAPRKSEST